MSRHTKKDRVKNECIRVKVEIAPIVENMIKSNLRRFSYVWRRFVKAQ